MLRAAPHSGGPELYCIRFCAWVRSTRMFLMLILAANASLGCNGKQRIAELRHGRTQKAQLIVVQPACKSIGNGGNKGCQFAWIHR